jgi:hypothetical protein
METKITVMETKIAVMEKHVTALLGHHGRNVLSAAAARIEELVIQAALGINRKTAADYKMYTVEHLINKRKSLPRALREKLTADVCASMKKTMANILSKPDVEAGVHAAEQLGYSAWRFDPCDNPTNWYKLPEYITMVFKDTEQVKVVRAMVNEYVLLRSAMSSECEHPAPPPAPGFGSTTSVSGFKRKRATDGDHVDEDAPSRTRGRR